MKQSLKEVHALEKSRLPEVCVPDELVGLEDDRSIKLAPLPRRELRKLAAVKRRASAKLSTAENRAPIESCSKESDVGSEDDRKKSGISPELGRMEISLLKKRRSTEIDNLRKDGCPEICDAPENVSLKIYPREDEAFEVQIYMVCGSFRRRQQFSESGHKRLSLPEDIRRVE